MTFIIFSAIHARFSQGGSIILSVLRIWQVLLAHWSTFMGPHEAWTGCDMRENKEIVSFDPRLRMPHSCELGLQCCWSTSSNLVVAAQSAETCCAVLWGQDLACPQAESSLWPGQGGGGGGGGGGGRGGEVGGGWARKPGGSLGAGQVPVVRSKPSWPLPAPSFSPSTAPASHRFLKILPLKLKTIHAMVLSSSYLWLI